jgi:hypothetical protein
MPNAIAAALLLALAAPAAAQTQAASGSNGTTASPLGIGFGETSVDEKTKTKREEAERAYKDAIKKTPAETKATANNDPWANMRGPDEQKPAAKPAARTAQKKKPAAH